MPERDEEAASATQRLVLGHAQPDRRRAGPDRVSRRAPSRRCV
jgi:hypothetical protein